MLNRGFGGGLGGMGSLGNTGNSADNYLRLLDSYGSAIAGQEAKLAQLRQQREAVAVEAELARQQKDAAAELAAAGHARAAAVEAERRTKESEVRAIQERNDSLRAEIQSLRNQLEQLKVTQYGSKEAFVERCMQLEAQIRAVLLGQLPQGASAAAATAPAALAPSGIGGVDGSVAASAGARMAEWLQPGEGPQPQLPLELPTDRSDPRVTTTEGPMGEAAQRREEGGADPGGGFGSQVPL